MTIVDGSSYVVSSGQTDVGDIIEDNGSIGVQSGGVTVSTTISSGYETVERGGVAAGTTIVNGFVQVLAGGTANGTTINGGHLDLYGGATANGIVDDGGSIGIGNGFTLSNYAISSGYISVESGGIDVGDVILSGAFEQVLSGGTANGTIVNDGGSLQLFGGASANGITLNSGGGLVIDSGYTLSDFVLSGGNTLGVASGGIANGTVISSGAIGDVASGGTANDTVVEYGGNLELFGGASADAITLNSGGVLVIVNGYTLSNFVLSGGDTLGVASGGIANGTVISSGAIEDVQSAGTASDTIVNDSGSLLLFGGATDLNATLNDGGAMFVDSGGFASGTTVESGGALVVSSGGSAVLGDLADGGSATINGGTLEIAMEAAASGIIEFSHDGKGTLQIDGTTMPAATISGFVTSDTVDLAEVPFSSGGIADLQSNNELHVSMGGNVYLLQLDPLQDYSSSLFRLSSDGNGGTVIEVKSGAALFTSGADNVDFNHLTTSQMAAIADGAQIYDGLGGNDRVTLPNVANYNEAVGGGKTLNWQNSTDQPFSTDSRPGDTYTVSGGDGNYYIDAGAGTDIITISGDGSSTVVGSAGIEKILFAGTGGNIVSAGGSGTYELIEAAGTNGSAVLLGNIVNTSSGVILASGAGAHIDLGDGTTISGGTLKTAGPSAVVDVIGAATNAAISGVTIAAGASLLVSDATLVVEGTIRNSGTINISPSTFPTTFKVVGSATLTGGGKISLSTIDTDYSQVVAGGLATLINVDNTIFGAGVIADSFLTLNNGGTINANSSNSLSIGAPLSLITNSGTLEATSTGGLDIYGIVGNTKTIEAKGVNAKVVIGGTAINNNGATIVASGNGAHVDLNSATIRGGTLKTTGTGAVIDAVSGTTDLLGGATIASGAKLEINPSATLIVAGLLNNSGTVGLSATIGATTLAISGGVTLTGGGKVTLSNDPNNAVAAEADTLATLTNVNNTIQGAGTLGGNDLTFINKGNVIANSSTALILDTGNAETTNSGKLEATSSGGLQIKSEVNNSNTIGAIGASASVELESTVSNTPSGVIQANGGNSHVDLVSANISGGTLKTSGTNAVIDAVAGTLNLMSGVTIAHGAVVEINDAVTLSLLGVIKNSGTISMGATSDPTALGILGALMLSGGGKVTLSDNSANAVDTDGGAVALTNVNNSIAGAGTIGNADLTLTNQAAGVINGDGVVNVLRLVAGTISNAGTLEGTTSQGLVISGAISNAKIIEAKGTSASLEIVGATISDASAGVILASGSKAQVELEDASIIGGKLQTSGTSAMMVIVSGSTAGISNVTDAAALTEVQRGASLTISGGDIAAHDIVDTLTGGTAVVNGTLSNGGTLFASGSGSFIEIASGAVVNGGVAQIGDGIVDIAGFSGESVKFLSNGTGGLEIADTQDQTSAFSGRVSGFGGSGHSNNEQFIDLISVTSALNTISLSYISAGSHTSGTLFVSSGGATVAAINMIGAYTSANFSARADGNSNVEIVDPTVANGGSIVEGPAGTFPRDGLDLPDVAFGAQTTLAYLENTSGTGGTLTVSDGRHAATIALLGNYMAGSFVAMVDGHGGTLVTQAIPDQQPMLTRPHPQ